MHTPKVLYIQSNSIKYIPPSFFPSLIADSAAAAPSAFPAVAHAFELPAAALAVAASSFSVSLNHSAISAARSYPPALSVHALPFVLVPVVEPVLSLPSSRTVRVVLSWDLRRGIGLVVFYIVL